MLSAGKELMQILSFDTSGCHVYIALLQDEQVVFEHRLSPQQKNRQEAASMLLPGIDEGMRRTGWAKSDLDLIVVGSGPGSFTGLRVGVLAARSIAQALNLGVVPVSILEVMACKNELPCAVVLDAGASKFYLGAYGRGEDGEPVQLFEPGCVDRQELSARLAGFERLVLDPALIRPDLTDGKQVVAYPLDTNLSTDLARLALKRIASTAKADRLALSLAYPWDNVLPLYLRSPSVTLKAPDGSSNKTIAG